MHRDRNIPSSESLITSCGPVVSAMVTVATSTVVIILNCPAEDYSHSTLWQYCSFFISGYLLFHCAFIKIVNPLIKWLGWKTKVAQGKKSIFSGSFFWLDGLLQQPGSQNGVGWGAWCPLCSVLGLGDLHHPGSQNGAWGGAIPPHTPFWAPAATWQPKWGAPRAPFWLVEALWASTLQFPGQAMGQI